MLNDGPAMKTTAKNLSGMNPHRILIIRFSSMGDLILTLPVIDRVHALFPEAKIDFLTKSHYAEILEHNPAINRIIPFLKKKDSIAELAALIRTLRNTPYDLVLDWHANLRSWLITLFLFPVRIIRYKKDFLRRRLLVKYKVKMSHFDRAAERYAATLSRFEAKGPLSAPHINLLESEITAVNKLISHKLGFKPSRCIALGPGAQHYTKRWPLENYKNLAKTLLEEKITDAVILLGDSNDRQYTREIKQTDSDRICDCAGLFSIRQSAAALSCANLVVTNDTGLMHLTTAVHKPVLAFFGPTVREFGFFPMGEKFMVLERDLPCRPCSIHGSEHCPLETLECMKSITVTEALNSIKRMIRQG